MSVGVAEVRRTGWPDDDTDKERAPRRERRGSVMVGFVGCVAIVVDVVVGDLAREVC